MPSTAAERLYEISLALQAAREVRANLPGNASQEQRTSLQTHIDGLQGALYRAGKQALDATGSEVEQAFKDAVSAREAVEDALAKAKETAERIRLVGKTVGTVGNLISKAGRLLA